MPSAQSHGAFSSSQPPCTPPQSTHMDENQVVCSTPKDLTSRIPDQKSSSYACTDDYNDSLSLRTWKSHSPLKIREKLSLLFPPSASHKPTSAFIVPDQDSPMGIMSGKSVYVGSDPADEAPDTLGSEGAAAAAATDTETLLNTIKNQRPVKEVEDISVPSSIPVSRLVIYLFPKQSSLFQLERELVCATQNFQLRTPWKLWLGRSDSDYLSDKGSGPWKYLGDINDNLDLNVCIRDQRLTLIKTERFAIAVFKEGIRPVSLVPRDSTEQAPPPERVIALIRIPIRGVNGYRAWKSILRFVLEDRGRFDSQIHQFLSKSSICGIVFQKGTTRPDIVVSLMLNGSVVQGSSIGIGMAKDICDLLFWCDPESFDPDSLGKARFETKNGRERVRERY